MLATSTITEITGRIDAIVWQSPENDAIVARLFRDVRSVEATNGHANGNHSSNVNPKPSPTLTLARPVLATIRGPIDPDSPPRPNVAYRWLGQWETHEKYGDQFAFQTYAVDAATLQDRAGVVAYLIAIADGIGPRRAGLLWDAFGPAAVATLRERPEEVAAKGILSLDLAKEAADSLADESAYENVKVELMGLLAGRGFQVGKLIRQCLRKWQDHAGMIVRHNPYTLMLRKFISCGFKRCDKLYLDLGGDPRALKRQTLLAQHYLRSDSIGHTWYDAKTVGQHIKDFIPSADPVRALKLGVKAGIFAIHREENGNRWLAERMKAANEASIAARIKDLSSPGRSWKPSLLWPDVSTLANLSTHQADVLRQALAKPVAILAGTPGTGKTYCAAAIVRALADKHGAGFIAICAPTGKAAVRCTEAMRRNGVPATITGTTIHSRLEIGRNGHDGEGWGFKRNEHNKLDQKFIIVDECFPGETLIDTPCGVKYIRNIRPGDLIINAAGVDRVVAVKKREVGHVCKITAGEKEIFCSTNHPIFTNRGLLVSSDIKPGDSLIQTAAALRFLREKDHSEESTGSIETFLRILLFSKLVNEISGEESQASYQIRQKKEGRCEKEMVAIGAPRCEQGNRAGQNAKPNHEAGSQEKAFGNPPEDWPSPHDSRRQWHWNDENRENVEACFGQAMAPSRCATRENSELSDALQGRSCQSGSSDSDRVGRPVSPRDEAERARREKDNETLFVRVDSIEVLEPSNPELDKFRDAGGKLYFFDLQAARHPSFSAEGYLVHNCSMLDTDLAASLLAACSRESHILFIGDPYQLSPVGHGAPLRDMIAGGVSCGTLTEIQRNAGQIVHACTAIKDRRKFETCDRFDLDAGKNLWHIEANTSDEQLGTLRMLYQTMRRSGKRDILWDVQVLVATNKSTELSRQPVNDLLQLELNSTGASVSGNPFHVGDKIICLRNQAAIEADPNDLAAIGTDDPVYVANGEIGQVRHVEAKFIVAQFFAPDRLIRIPMGKKKQGQDDENDGGRATNEDFDLGYAITVHKSQGSEWPVVIILIDGSGAARRVCSQEHVYTAISRASQLCILIGKKGVLEQLARKQALERRKTFLRELLSSS